jgi:hypothetical protein
MERCWNEHDDLVKERDELVAALRRHYKADLLLYNIRSDCEKEDYEAALNEHDESHSAISAILSKYKETS